MSSEHEDEQIQSSEPTMNRQEFFQTLLSRARGAGALVVGTMAIESFLLPKAFASASTCSVSSTGGFGGDTAGAGTSLAVDETTIFGGLGDNPTAPGHVEGGCSKFQSDTGQGPPIDVSGVRLYFCTSKSVC